MSELTRLSAAEMAEQVRRKKVSPVELVEAHLARIERLNPKLNAFISMDAERALQAARAAEKQVTRGGELGPLLGVPISIKSSIEVAGLSYEAGTKLRAGCKGASDAPLVKRLKAAGAIVLGTTNTPEILMAWETDNLLYGRTNSPWDLARTPGGSSGGEAAAIASGCSAAGVGSDGGGSIRVPAHFSGICGLKPTPGRISIAGHFPPSGGPFTRLGVVGPMARTVADLQLMFQATAGPDPADIASAPVPLRPVSDSEARKLRVGYFEDDGRTPVTPETRAAVLAAAETLRHQGYEVVPFRPEGLEKARQLWWTFFGVAGGMLLGPMLAGHEAELSPILTEFRGWVAAEPPLTDGQLLTAWLERDQVRAEVLSQMERFPILLCPVCAVPAFRHREREWSVNGSKVRYLDAMSYSAWFNLLGFPGASVPVGQSPEGLPIGVQIVGRAWEEESVLTVAAAVEREHGFREPAMKWTRWAR
jgi:Asp-tRNA(Asn)/Glu-tRNA(Gln) amidotransferase A subunit family amidase